MLARKRKSESSYAGGDLGGEVGEDVEVGGERVGGVEVVEVGAGPVEGEAGRVLDACGVDAFAGEDLLVLGEEVLPDDADDAGWGEEGGGEREVGGCAAEDLAGLAVRGFEGVKGYGADYEDGHCWGGISGSGWIGVSFYYAGLPRLLGWSGDSGSVVVGGGATLLPPPPPP